MKAQNRWLSMDHTNDLEELERIIAGWGPEDEAWDRIAEGVEKSDPMADILDRTGRLDPELLREPMTM